MSETVPAPAPTPAPPAPSRRGARIRWVLLLVLVPLAYQGLRLYALGSHSLETILGLAPGSKAFHACVAAALLCLRFGAYGVLGGAALAWPLEEWLVRRRRRLG